MKLKKQYKIILNYVVGPILFMVLAYSIYRKVQQQPNSMPAWELLQHAWDGTNRWKLMAVALLTLVNWGIEARKWQVLVKPVQRISLFTAYKSVLSGLAFSLFVPNRLGEYVGRVLHMGEGNRLRSVAFTVVAGLAQLIVTLIMGVVGLIYLRMYLWPSSGLMHDLSDFWFWGFAYAMGIIALVFVLVYYKLSWLTQVFERISWVHKYRYFIQHLEDFHWRELTRILTLSISRYIVFILQYWLMLQVFNVQLPLLAGIWLVCVFFLVMAVVPTIPMAELGLRGQASLQLFGLLSSNHQGIIYTAAGIWLLNLIIPAMAGSIFVLSIRLFSKPEATTPEP